MELKHLKYFKLIAETENISDASRRLHVSQPFLSRTIHLLEEELNLSLFDRHGKKIELNKNGKILYRYTLKMLDLEAQAIQELTLASQKGQPSVKLILFNATKLFPELIAGFSDSHPDIRFSISNYEKERMKQSYDVVIHASEELAALLPSQLLFQEECLLGMSIHHPLAKEKEITPSMLQNEKFILLTQENTLGDLTRRYFVPLGIHPKVPLECDNQQTVTALVEQNMGLAFFPAITWKVMTDQITLRKIPNYTLKRNIYLSCSSPDPSKSVSIFIDYMKKAIRYELHKEEYQL